MKKWIKKIDEFFFEKNPFILVLLEILLFISSIVYLACVICKYYI